ncbi:MAG: metallophosphoesterase [Syntrophobacterales bacterium]|nr:metallophosphoesterase [Syntrophobacterales bacterium]
MLVFISDLHFTDGTAGEHNLNPRAFDYFFDDLEGIITDPRNQVQEFILVFLGDIFDLLRTTHWFGYPEDERPWGKNHTAMEVHAATLFDLLAANPKNRESFSKIRARLEAIRTRVPQVQVLYLPGNHDRLVNLSRRLRDKACQALGLTQDPQARFPHRLEFPAYGVFARHGHEYDYYNYEGGPAQTEADYDQVPIGDPITTELVSRLPFELERRLQLPAPDKQRLVANFQDIDNVRPLSAVVEWLLYQVEQQPAWLRELIEDVVDDCIRDFYRLEFVTRWFHRHDKWLDPFDKADQIQMALFILEKFKVFSLDKLWSLASRAKGAFMKDDLLAAAPEEEALRDPRLRFVVYGHTHDPLVVPLRRRFQQEQIYLNTGTWRARHTKSLMDASFVSWKNLTYVIFFRSEERPGRQALFETWTGTLKEA